MNECCNKFFHTDFTYTVGDVFLITPDSASGASSVCNRECFDLRLCRCLPTTITIPLQVFIQVNGASVPMLDRYGNNVYTNQLKLRKTYRGVYGSTPTHVLFWNEYGY